MNIGALSTPASVAVPGDIGMAIMAKAMESTQVMGQGMVEMLDASAMELSVNPHIGSNVDIRV
jgi:cyanophycinase-like exopeptidase